MRGPCRRGKPGRRLTPGRRRFLDLRAGRAAHEWHPTSVSPGPLRAVAVDTAHAFVAVGFGSGLVSLLDATTGLLLLCWRAHDSDVLQIKTLPDGHFLTRSADGAVALWRWSAREVYAHCVFRHRGSRGRQGMSAAFLH